MNDHFGRHDGRVAIVQWIEDTARVYDPVFVLVKPAVTEGDAAVTVSLAGHFPGSPVQLDFHFWLRGQKIVALTID